MKSTSLNSDNRIISIDILRGLVMVIMALDHTRDFFHKYSFEFEPTDLEHTSPAIFLTRWITHFCAPVFVFLSGTSAFLSGKRKSKEELSSFLWKRGLWIIFLELTVNCLAWTFSLNFANQVLQVLWAIGASMIILSFLIKLPMPVILLTGLILVAGHNLLDQVHFTGNNVTAFFWSILHEFGVFTFGPVAVTVVYPIIPWIGVMALGYCLGRLFLTDISYSSRRKKLISLGLSGIVLFVILRAVNIYGDASPWSPRDSSVYSLLSFVNTSKYPPSFLFLLMTISPAMILLALLEKFRNRFSSILISFGRVPMFYYLIHVFVIHLAAMITAVAMGFPYKAMILDNTWISDQAALRGYGFGLPVVYLVWLAVVTILYFPCKWYDKYKSVHSYGWLKYL